MVSFHFGLPEPELLARVKKAGCKIISSATTLREALWLAERGVDAIIAQGSEAGGHRGMFLETDIATQIGTFALVQQIVEAVKVPVIAAGGIGDGRSITAAFVLGAAGVQIGTAYLGCPEATISALHREALRKQGRETVITNVLSGTPGPLDSEPHDPRAGPDQHFHASRLPARHAGARAAPRQGRSKRTRAISRRSGRARERRRQKASAPRS